MSARTSGPALAGRCRSRVVRILLMVGVAVASLLGGADVVSATVEGSNSLQSITPADGESVQTPPTEVVLSFNQEVDEQDDLGVTVSCNNQPQQVGTESWDDDRLVATLPLISVLPSGACNISWFLRNVDGETIANGLTTFSVLEDAAATTTAAPGGVTTTTSEFVTVPATPPTSGEADTDSPGNIGGALWLGRWISTLGIFAVFGGLALISVGWPEGPEYIVTVRYLRAAWLLSLAGTVLYVISFTADAGGMSFASAASPGSWLDLSDAGWEGRGALLRLVLVVATGWVAVRPERIIDPTSAMWAWGIPGLALVTVAMGRIEGPLVVVGFLVDVVHVLAAAIWFGGAALVARVVLAGPGEEDLVHATRAFSRVSVPAMFVTAVTGVIQVIRLDGGELFTSSHGRVLLLKVIVVAAMLAVSVAIRQQVTVRLDRAHEMTAPLADRFRRAFHAEAALGVVVLAFSGWLLQLTPPSVDPFADQTYLPEIPINNNSAGLDASIFIGPGQAGPTGLRVEVDAPTEGITDLRLRFIPPATDPTAWIIEQPIPLTGTGIAVLDEDDGLPLNTPGTWTLQVFAVTTVGVLDGAERTFALTDSTGAFPTVPPAAATQPSLGIEEIVPSTTAAPFATTTVPTTAPPTTAPDG